MAFDVVTKLGKIKFGIILDRCHWYRDVAGQTKSEVNWDRVAGMAIKCDDLGFDAIYGCDHLSWEGGAMLEWGTTKAAIAAITKRAQLGETVVAVGYRNPAVLAKMVANIDFISHGRVILGIGAGWAEQEYTGYGLPFPKPAVRIGQLREAVKICKLMWTEKRPKWKGKYYQIDGPICEPKPVQKPRPPIMIGGGGEQLTLRVVAQEADEWNFFGSVKSYAHKLDVLRKHCAVVGRNYDEIKKQWSSELIIYRHKEELADIVERTPGLKFTRGLMPLTQEYVDRNLIGTTDEIIDQIQKRIDIGVTTFLTYPRKGTEEEVETYYDKVVKAFK